MAKLSSGIITKRRAGELVLYHWFQTPMKAAKGTGAELAR